MVLLAPTPVAIFIFSHEYRGHSSTFGFWVGAAGMVLVKIVFCSAAIAMEDNIKVDCCFFNQVECCL